MKRIHSILALCVAFALTGLSTYADQPTANQDAPKTAPCGCEVKKDGKVCGVDTKCCCTGEKAKGRAPEKKAAKDECSDGKCGDKAKDSCDLTDSGK